MKYKAVLLRSFGLLLAAACVLVTKAQDTLQLTVPKAEAIFLETNLSVLAAQYNINASQALIQQAKAWNNPVLYTDQNLYDGKFFRHTKGSSAIPQDGGQIYLSLQQLIQTAGKRNKLVQIARDNTNSAAAQFKDLVRNLHFVLVTDLNNLSQLKAAEGLYQQEILHLQKLSKGMDEMLKVGDVSQKEDLRIKALLFSLQSEYADNLVQQQDLEKEVRTLLQLKQHQAITVPQPQLDEQNLSSLALAPLLDSAKTWRPDLEFANSQLALQQHNYTYQKALAVPDLTLGVEYDKANSYVANFYGLQLSLPLPVFNRNRGNIVSAAWNIKQAQTVAEQNKSQVQNEVLASYHKLLTLINVQKSAKGTWSDDYNKLLQNMISSYQQRKVSLIDFIDFFSSYKETRLKQLKQQTDVLNAAAELNFVTNQNLISLK
jgi:cobalt-zinc-cadmium efflux system outer membrane protein